MIACNNANTLEAVYVAGMQSYVSTAEDPENGQVFTLTTLLSDVIKGNLTKPCKRDHNNPLCKVCPGPEDEDNELHAWMSAVDVIDAALSDQAAPCGLVPSEHLPAALANVGIQ